MSTDNVIRLADHRPAPPARPRRLARLMRWSDDILCTVVVAAGLCAVAWAPGAAIEGIVGRMWPDRPWLWLAIVRTGPGLVFGMWAALSMHRLQRRPEVTACTVNVHVFDDETALVCRCGATGDVDGAGGAA